MPSWDFYRSINSMRILTELAVEYGLPVNRVLAGTGIGADQLQSPDAVVESQQELRLIRNLVEDLGHIPALGVIAGQRYHFTSFGALGFALVSSPTLRDAMEIGLKYIQLTFAFCRFDLLDRGQHARVVMDNREVPEEVRRFVVERDSACFVTLQRDIFNSLSPLEALHFSFSVPEALGPYEEFYAVKPEFGMPLNELVFDRTFLTQPMPQASDLALRSAEQQCENLLNQRLKRAGLSAQVRHHLASRAADMPNMEEVSRMLNTIPRTLRRRLQREKTSFAELRDEVRQTLAEEYLSGPRLSVEQVAERLGYAEATSFINAYKRWHGATPSAYRRKKRAL